MVICWPLGLEMLNFFNLKKAELHFINEAGLATPYSIFAIKSQCCDTMVCASH